MELGRPVIVAVVILAGVAALAAYLLAIVVYRAQPDGKMNRRLAGLLAVDGTLLAVLVLDSLTSFTETSLAGATTLAMILTLDGFAHLLFVATLESRIARWLRSRMGLAVFGLGALGVGLGLPAYAFAQGLSPFEGFDWFFGAGWLYLALASIVALIVSLQAWRVTDKGTAAHRRAARFALAFCTRDAFMVVSIFLWALFDDLGLYDARDFAPAYMVVGGLLFVILLAYGLLSVQLFDIDLKIKWGAARGSVVVFIVVAALATAKIVEFYVNKNVGLVFGGIMAGLTLFLSPRLNKIADKAANKAMPAVQPTSEYLSFKKLEVYRAAVESAMEGGLTPKDRTMLDRLQQKLGLSKQDASALEAELAPASAASAA